MPNDELIFCERRGLWIRPERDCRHCAWYECERHPKHDMWPAVQHILAGCPTSKQSGRLDLKGKKKQWDGEREHCMRYNWRKGNPGYDDACKNCTLSRPCEHRGKARMETEAYIKKLRLKKRKAKRKQRWEDGMFYITKDRHRFVVRIQIGGKQTTIGRYGTPEEAKIARDAALLKLDGKPVDVQ